MITQAETQLLSRWFDTATLFRGESYAHRRAVIEARWSADGMTVSGTVLGSAPEPYATTATLVRSTGGRLLAVEGECTCPMEVDCKHVVALLLTTPVLTRMDNASGKNGSVPTRALRATSTATGSATTWEASLAGWLPAGRPPANPDESGIGLQFELVADRSGPSPPWRIRLRPVLPGRSGGWIRNGVSWTNIRYMGRNWRRQGIDDGQIELFVEIKALADLTESRSYYADDPVWLDAMRSGRIWDVLREAGARGIPLVSAGRRAEPVTVFEADATVSLDLVAAADEGTTGILVTTRLAADGVSVPLSTASSMLVGDPVHGVAWWDPGAGNLSAGTPALSLAGVAGPRTGIRRSLLVADPVVIPNQDVDRFFGDYLPRLVRKVAVGSSDDSVEIPEIPDDALFLAVRHLDGHRIELTWTTGPPGTSLRQPLDAVGNGPVGGSAAATAARATEILGAHGLSAASTSGSGGLQPAMTLESMQTVRFLSDVLGDLESVAGLMVEHVGSALDYRPATEAPVVSLAGGSPEGDWFDLRVEVSVGGEEVPFHELFRALALEQSHMILPSGTYFSLDSDDLHRLADLIAEARNLHETAGDSIRLSRYQASMWEELVALGVITTQAAAWQEAVSALSSSAGRTGHPVPSTLAAVLRPYQKVGFDWLVFLFELGLGGILADDMGLGKTLQAIALFCHVRATNPTDRRPFLVVAPTSVVGNWAAECLRFAPSLAVETVRATGARRADSMADVAGRADVVVTSYALFRLEYEAYEQVEWAGLILDEAQFAKNAHSHAFRRAKTLPVPFKVAMTGTPMENHLMELWALLSITAPGLFPHAERFHHYYRLPIERGTDPERLDLLRRRIRALVLRRRKEDVVADLPPKLEQVLELDLVPRHRRVYQTYLQRERQKVLGLLDDVKKNRFEILKSLTVLRQAALDASLIDPVHAKVPSTKLDALDELLAEIVEDGHRVLVFSQFTRFLSLARDRARSAGIDHCYLDGRTRKRTAVIDRFRAGEAPVFFISLKAGGFGLNLTEADYCVILDPWWNPASEAQAIDRTHRIGQTKRVMVYRLVAKETIEEKVMAMKAKKAALFASVIDGGGFERGALSADDIRGLLD